MADLRATRFVRETLLGRRALTGVLILVAAVVGLGLTVAGAAPAAQNGDDDVYTTLRVHGYPVASDPQSRPVANVPSSAGSIDVRDPNTDLVPEDAPYTDPQGPFDPLSDEAPRMDFVTWDPAWVSERLGDPALRAQWTGLTGIDEVSRAAHIRSGNIDASEKVWLRHWYEPQHLDKDLNADGRLTDRDNNAVPDAPMNPVPNAVDEWYPAIMTEYTFMFVDNDPLPMAAPAPAQLHSSAPRPVCGAAGSQFVFPIGTAEGQLDQNSPQVGYGLTSLDADLDGRFDMVRISDERNLPGLLGGTRIDFDGDGRLDRFNSNGNDLDCDEMAIFHTNALPVERGGTLQFLDHFVKLESLTDSSAILEIWRNSDLTPNRIARTSVGVGGVLLAGDSGPADEIAPGGTNLGTVPAGGWFVYLSDLDTRDDTAVLIVGRALGAPCASMETAPNVVNLSAGGPWFLKRFYVDGAEYNVTAIGTCGRDEFQYITIRNPLPKVPTTIEQHSVRLQPYVITDASNPPWLPLIPPFNHEHTVLEDIVALESFPRISPLPSDPLPVLPRPLVTYMGGPIGPLAPVLESASMLPYDGRDPSYNVGPYDDIRASRWTYIHETVDPLMVGQIREKLGVRQEGDLEEAVEFFYNEQVWTMPYHYTEFILPDFPDGPGDPPAYHADRYHVTSAFVAPTARSRRWEMPDGPVPSTIPPNPPDLVDSFTPDTRFPFGAPRRASFWFDPDTPDAEPVKLWLDQSGARLFGGQPELPGVCTPLRPGARYTAGDRRFVTEPGTGYPIEIGPYTDPWAPFNSQHAHAPRSDSLTVNPAYMDEYRNSGEALEPLYEQLSNNRQNAREKVYHRVWYEPDHIHKVRYTDDCSRDVRFPALMQEYTYLFVDTTDNPLPAPAGTSRFAFPIGTRSNELPEPQPGGTLPSGGEFGYGLTTFDANFDGDPEAVTIHSEQTLAQYLDTEWRSNRPDIPGFPPPAVPGPELDFDGDGDLDDLDEDGDPLTGDELLVIAVADLTLDLDEGTAASSSAMVLDHLVTLENVTRGSRAQVRFWFTGGNGTDSRPEAIGGLYSLDIGDAAIVDRFQGSVTVVNPGERNDDVDGAWFVFVNDVATDHDRVTITVGRALGATHSAIDDGQGRHDLEEGDPWYLKRFYVDGHPYDVVAVMTHRDGDEDGELFSFITIRTAVPKRDAYNPQDTLMLQGYYEGSLPDQVSVMPPFNVRHTIVEDIERMSTTDFARRLAYGGCVGELKAFGPLVETIVDEAVEPRYGVELKEIFDPRDERDGWETDQVIVIPNQYTDLKVSEGQKYLYTSNWRSQVSRAHYYGCLRGVGPLPGVPAIPHGLLAAIADDWAPPAPDNIVLPPNQQNPPQPIPLIVQDPVVRPMVAPYYDGALGGPGMRVKLFYDPSESMVDIYVNRGRIPWEPPTVTPTTPPPTTTTPPPTTVTPTTVTPTTVTPTTETPTTVTPVPTTPVPTTPPPPPDFRLGCLLVQEDPFLLTWTDATTFETEFQFEVTSNGSDWMPLYPSKPSVTQSSTGTAYEYLTGNVPYNGTFQFRMRSYNSYSREASSWSTPSQTCYTPRLPSHQLGCYSGQINLQGRDDHSGAAVYIDGYPMASTDQHGNWSFCGATIRQHNITSRDGCYLENALYGVQAVAGHSVRLPLTTLAGGDVDNNTAIDLFDLVRVGTSYGTAPPSDPAADCNADDAVNLFDLVMVGTNYGVHGPLGWYSNLNSLVVDPIVDSAVSAFSALDSLSFGAETGVPVKLVSRGLEGGQLTVDVVAQNVSDLYGADLGVVFDPRRLEVVDAAPDASGLQVSLSDVWADAFVARHAIDAERGEIHLAASLIAPSEPLSGDVVLATVTFRVLGDDDPEEAYSLGRVVLADVEGRPIGSKWAGVKWVARGIIAELEPLLQVIER